MDVCVKEVKRVMWCLYGVIEVGVIKYGIQDSNGYLLYTGGL